MAMAGELNYVDRELGRRDVVAREEVCREVSQRPQQQAWSCGEDWRNQLGTHMALSRHGAPHSPWIPELRELLYDEDPNVRNLIVTCLAEGKVEARAKQVGSLAVSRTQTLLRTPDPRIRRGALEAIVNLRDDAREGLLDDVVTSLWDEDKDVREAASKTLRSWGPSSVARAVSLEVDRRRLFGGSWDVGIDLDLLVDLCGGEEACPFDVRHGSGEFDSGPGDEVSTRFPFAAQDNLSEWTFEADPSPTQGAVVAQAQLPTDPDGELNLTPGVGEIDAPQQRQLVEGANRADGEAADGGAGEAGERAPEEVALGEVAASRDILPAGSQSFASFCSTTGLSLGPDSDVAEELEAPELAPPPKKKSSKKRPPSLTAVSTIVPSTASTKEVTLDPGANPEATALPSSDAGALSATQLPQALQAVAPASSSTCKACGWDPASQLLQAAPKFCCECGAAMGSNEGGGLAPMSSALKGKRRPPGLQGNANSNSNITNPIAAPGGGEGSAGTALPAASASAPATRRKSVDFQFGGISPKEAHSGPVRRRSKESTSEETRVTILSLASALDGGTTSSRVKALESLGRQPPAELEPLIPRFVEKLDDDAWEVRLAAADVLGLVRAGNNKEAVAALMRCTQDRRSLVRAACAKALGRLGAASSAETLGNMLEDTEEDVRKEASRALGQLGPCPAAGPAGKRLGHDNPEVRLAAQEALLETKKKVEAMSQDAAPGFAMAAQQAMVSSIRAQVEPWLKAQRPSLRSGAAGLLLKLGAAEADRNLRVRCAVARLEDDAEEVRLSALRSLEDIIASAVSKGSHSTQVPAEPLARCLSDDSSAVRNLAVAVVSLYPQLRAPPTGTSSPLSELAASVAEYLNHGLQPVRRAASAAIAALGDEVKEQYAAQCSLAMTQDSEPQARCSGVEALLKLAKSGRLEDSHVSSIARLRLDPHWTVRRAAAEALARCGSDALQRHSRELDQLELDPDWRVRRAAAAAKAQLLEGH